MTIYIVIEEDRGYGPFPVKAFYDKEKAESFAKNFGRCWVDTVELE